jgi:hypothetical protein
MEGHPNAQNWGARTSNNYQKGLRFLSRIGSDTVSAMSPEQLNGLDDAAIKAMAKDVVEKQAHAKWTVDNTLHKKRSSLIGGAFKASASTMGGAIQGAAIGGVLALVTRPLDYVMRKVTGGKISLGAKPIIALFTIFYGTKNTVHSLSNSYLEPGFHNADMKNISQQAVEKGMRDALAARAQGQGKGPTPGAPNPNSPTSPGGGSPGAGDTVRDATATTPAEAVGGTPASGVAPAAMASTVVAPEGAAVTPTAPSANAAEKVAAALQQVQALPRGAKLPVEDLGNVSVVNFKAEKTPGMDESKAIGS